MSLTGTWFAGLRQLVRTGPIYYCQDAETGLMIDPLKMVSLTMFEKNLGSPTANQDRSFRLVPAPVSFWWTLLKGNVTVCCSYIWLLYVLVPTLFEMA